VLRLTGFEPDRDECELLRRIQPFGQFEPYALDDGDRDTSFASPQRRRTLDAFHSRLARLAHAWFRRTQARAGYVAVRIVERPFARLFRKGG
jgi:hypothetical protein